MLVGRLKQSRNYIDVSEGFEVFWVFAQQDSAGFAGGLFSNADDGQKRIHIEVVPRLGVSK